MRVWIGIGIGYVLAAMILATDGCITTLPKLPEDTKPIVTALEQAALSACVAYYTAHPEKSKSLPSVLCQLGSVVMQPFLDMMFLAMEKPEPEAISAALQLPPSATQMGVTK